MPGTTFGATCGRRVTIPHESQGGPPTHRRCGGTIEVVARGTDGNGQPRDVLGCTTCWTTLKPAVTPPVDVPLFGGEG